MTKQTNTDHIPVAAQMIGKDPLKGRTLYEQIRIAARNYGWPDDAAHSAANSIVLDIKDNSPCTNEVELSFVLRDALRTDGE